MSNEVIDSFKNGSSFNFKSCLLIFAKKTLLANWLPWQQGNVYF